MGRREREASRKGWGVKMPGEATVSPRRTCLKSTSERLRAEECPARTEGTGWP